MSTISTTDREAASVRANDSRVSTKRRVAWTSIGVVIALGFPFLPIGTWMNQFASAGHLLAHECVWWVVVAVMLVLVRAAERRPLSSIGLRPLGRADILTATVAGIAILAGLACIYYLVLPLLDAGGADKVNQLLATPLWWRCLVVLRAAVSEEVLYRGYAIERLTELTGRRAVAAIVSCAAFMVVHVGWWGWGHLFIAGFGGAALTALYLWRRNLGVNILAHAIVDGVALLAA